MLRRPTSIVPENTVALASTAQSSTLAAGRHGRLAISANPKTLKDKQITIIDQLHSNGLSYDGIAQIFGIDYGANIRNYVKRDNKRSVRVDNKYLNAIHSKLISPDDNVSTLVPSSLISDYQSLFGSTDENVIHYVRRTDKNITSASLFALSQIASDIYNLRSQAGASELRRVTGKYYAYRNSSEENVILKSFLEIREHSRPGTYFDFEHFHADRYYDSERDAPRRTHGLVFYLNNNLFLIGNSENGQAINILAIRAPFRDSFNKMAGFNLTTNMDHILLSASTILIKDADASVEGITRIPVSSFDKKAEHFDKSLLRNPKKPHICHLISMVRVLA